MEIKHTIEILTKDIQDIEKLVRNLNNNPVPPSIELDLALSKLRHVYELLLMIRTDSISELNAGYLQENSNEKEESQADLVPPVEQKPQPEKTDPVMESSAAEMSPPAKEQPSPPKREKISEQVTKQSDEGTAKKIDEHQEDIIPREKIPQEKKASGEGNDSKAKQAAILGEKFKQDRSLNEQITGKGSPDVSSRLSGSPIDSIARNIGINDRFQIIRELLNGDNEAYAQLIQSLDASTNFNDAFHILENRFPDNLENESVQLLVNLSRRRFISIDNV